MEENLPINWIRAKRWCDITGVPMDTVESYIRDGQWAADKHYKRTGPRTLWINAREADKWIASQPHVETVPFPRESKSATGSAAAA